MLICAPPFFCIYDRSTICSQRQRQLDEEREQKRKQRAEAERRQKQEVEENKIRRVQLKASCNYFKGNSSKSFYQTYNN